MTATPLRFWPDAAKASEEAARAAPRATPLNYSFCSVDVRHDYCAARGDAFEGLAIAPTPETQARLSRWGIICRPRPDGFDLIADSDRFRALDELVAGLKAKFPGGLPQGFEDALLGPALLFTVEVADADFFNFTDIPLDVTAGNPALDLTNRKAERVGADGYALAIDWMAAVYAPAKPASPSEAPPSEPPPLRLPPSPSEILGRDLGGAAGRLLATRGEIWRAHSEFRAFRAERGRLPFALLSVYPVGQPGGAEPVQLVPRHGHYLRAVRYTITFTARRTFWRYILASRAGDFDPQGFEIVDCASREPAAFKAERRVQLPDGRFAVRFVSSESRALARRSGTGFALQRKSGPRGRPRMMIPRLPNPGPATPIVADRRAGSKVYSDMYVFV
jgi:hypothetical protein